jgi:P-type Ca2+ transporter type 2C
LLSLAIGATKLVADAGSRAQPGRSDIRLKANKDNQTMSEWYQQSKEDVLAELETRPRDGPQPLLKPKRGWSSTAQRAGRARHEEPLAYLVGAIHRNHGGYPHHRRRHLGVLGETTDAIVIMAIVVMNALLGYSQEARAEEAIAALKKMAVPTVKVKREGHIVEVSAREVVPGDIVFLEAGNKVPADGRLVESANLQAQEAALTGESTLSKSATASVPDDNLALGDRRNMVYMGTIITYGRGTMVVTGTGMRTELGKIADMIQDVEREPTPCSGASMAWARRWRWRHWASSPSSSCSAASRARLEPAHPDGDQHGRCCRARRPACRRDHHPCARLAAHAEAQRPHSQAARRRDPRLSHHDLLRQDRHADRKPHDGHRARRRRRKAQRRRAARKGYPRLEHAEVDPSTLEPPERSQVLLIKAMTLANDAVLEEDEDRPGEWKSIGDPTEGALVVAAAELGLKKEELGAALAPGRRGAVYLRAQTDDDCSRDRGH